MRNDICLHLKKLSVAEISLCIETAEKPDEKKIHRKLLKKYLSGQSFAACKNEIGSLFAVHFPEQVKERKKRFQKKGIF